MANDSLKTIEIMNETFADAFEANCVLSKMVDRETIDGQVAQRAGDVIYERQNYHASTVAGLDISAATAMDVVDRAVPMTFSTPQNVLFRLNSMEMRDPVKMEKTGEAAGKALAALIDQTLYARAVARANITLTQTGILVNDTVAAAEQEFIQRGISMNDASFVANAADWRALSKDLAGRQYISDRTKEAYERSQVPDVANFMTYRTDNLVNVAIKGTVTGTTVNGNQSATVTSKDANGIPVDNRQMVLTVAGVNVANIKAGDRFTIGTLNAVHMITKSDTNSLQTFTVISVAGAGTLLTISPAIVATGPYQNVTGIAATGATLTFINNATKPANLFFAPNAIKLKYGRLEWPTDMGPKVMTTTTETGAPLCLSYDFNHLTGVCTARFHTYFAAEAVDPEKIGIILANQ